MAYLASTFAENFNQKSKMSPNTNISVHLTPELRLEQALKGANVEDPASVSQLTVSGMLTDDDFRYISKKMGDTLQELILSKDAAIEKISSRYRDLEYLTCLTTITVHPDNPDFADHDGVLFNKVKTELIFCPRKKQGHYMIPSSVITIHCDAFKKCTGLISIIFNSVINLGRFETFEGCTALMSVTVANPNNPFITSENGVVFNKAKTRLYFCPQGWQGHYSIPHSVTEICDGAFRDCTGLTLVDIPQSVVRIGYGAFQSCTGLTSVVIPYSVIEIKDRAFNYCTGLTTVNMSKSVAMIGFDAFYNCCNLTSVIIPDSVVEIGRGAFYGCSGLTSIVIPDSVVIIRRFAFLGCSGLTSVVIPVSVVEVEKFVFKDCFALTSITVHPDNPFYASNDGVLFNKAKTELIFCPPGKQSVMVIPDSTVNIQSRAFQGCRGLTSVVIPESVTKIEENTFEGCIGLTSIHIPNTVVKIENYAFKDCIGLTSVTIPDSATEIGNAFCGCTSLISIHIPKSLKKIVYSDHPFQAHPSVFISDTVNEITVDSDNPEYSCHDGVLFNKSQTILVHCPRKRQGDYVVPDTTVKIREKAFLNCKDLTVITIPASVTDIGYEAFSGCNASLTIHPDNPVYAVGNGKPAMKIKSACGQAGKLEWSFADGVLSISGDGELPDYNNFPDNETDEGAGLVPWYNFRENIKSVVFKGSVTKKGWYGAFSNAISSVTFERDAGNVIDRVLNGYTTVDTWNLHDWFADVIPRMLRQFRNETICVPWGMTMQEWYTILERMIYCFEMMKVSESGSDEDTRECRDKLKNEGLELFQKYFWNLSW